MTCRQSRNSKEALSLSPATAARMQKVQDNMIAFTTRQVPQLRHERPSMRDYKDLRMSFRTRMKIWAKRLRGY